MTDQLERDLTALFAQRAADADVPPMPPELFPGEDRRGPGRRVVVALVAAAAVAAVAIPVGLSSHDGDDVQPAPAPEPTESHGTGVVTSIDVPYLRDGVLHVDDVAIPTEATALVGAGDHVYVGTSGRSWERLVDDRLEPAPYLDGSPRVFVSPDGSRVAALLGDGQTAVALMDPERPESVSTYTLAEPAGEDPWVLGFDTGNRLFLRSGSELLMKELAAEEVVVQAGDRLLAALAPVGPVMVRPSGAVVATIADDGTVTDGYDVPVSTAGVWADDGRLAYTDGPGLRVVRPQAGTDPVRLMTDTEGTVQPLGWSDGQVVAQVYSTPRAEGRVVLVDPGSGVVEELFEVPVGDDSIVFPEVAGTGAL